MARLRLHALEHLEQVVRDVEPTISKELGDDDSLYDEVIQPLNDAIKELDYITDLGGIESLTVLIRETATDPDLNH
ncbi:MAG: hypothetical protein OXC13_16890 [Caldilineaceae bacterium]|nr:hypothetical protein [Caldilineaceae bacterium]